MEAVSASCTLGPVRKTVWFDQMTLNELRNLAKWPDGSRQQILAWCRNRYKGGFMYAIEENPSVLF